MSIKHARTERLLPALDPVEMNGRITGILFRRRAPWAWYWVTAATFLLVLAFLAGLGWLLYKGVGIFGVNIPIAWAFPIINTIWWIGIAHAGTLISAVLLLTRQPWRAPIARAAEAMAMFAIILAGTYTLMHLGRPWFAYFLLPYPSSTGLWPQWRSALIWDFFSIATYVLYTLCFLYLSLLPDLATLRDRAQDRAQDRARQLIYGVLALGWRFSIRDWHRYEQANRIFSALAAPLVVAVTGTISLDLAISIVPGFHFTIFPPYFVAGAIYSGFATVTLIAILLRSLFGLKDFIHLQHLDYLGRMMLVFALVVDYSYVMEIFTAFYHGESHPRELFYARWTGPYAPAYWAMVLLNVVAVQLLWWRRVRRSVPAMFLLALGADVGMWLERFIIVVTSTQRDYLPSTWRTTDITAWDWLTFAGSIGVFLFLLLLFVRFLPAVSLHDMRSAMAESGQENKRHG